MKNAHTVLIIGMGNLGVRHFQSTIDCKIKLDIYLYDINVSYIERIAEFNYIESIHSVFILDSLNELPKSIEIVIIATSADVRKSILVKIANLINIKYLVLEKFLFQKKEDFFDVEKILNEKNIRTFVNTNRRMMQSYKRLKINLSDNIMTDVVINGGNWGLACNSIHMLDLIGFLSDGKLIDFNSEFDKGILQSKRKGFIEVLGEVSGRMSNVNFRISSNDSEDALRITIVTNKKLIYIVESKRKLMIIDESLKMTEYPFEIEYQSKLTSKFIESLLIYDKCDLTTYKESINYHLAILDEIFTHQNKTFKEEGGKCLIT